MKPLLIPQADIDSVARAMALAVHQGPDDVPDRDVDLYRERAKLFLAAQIAVKSGSEEKRPTPSPTPARPFATPAPQPSQPFVPAPSPQPAPLHVTTAPVPDPLSTVTPVPYREPVQE